MEEMILKIPIRVFGKLTNPLSSEVFIVPDPRNLRNGIGRIKFLHVRCAPIVVNNPMVDGLAWLGLVAGDERC
jgi:hypothetical protein